MKKRVLSILLCMALCVGLLPGVVSAKELTVTTGTVAAGSYALSGDLTATGDITLANGVTIDGGGKTINIGSHILSVEGNSVVTLRNAKISTTNHASNNAFGAIRVLAANVSDANAYSGGGTLILDNCSITCNTKTDRRAIEIVNSSTLYANNVKIENCGSAISDSVQNNNAGATAYLSNCTITENSSGVSWSNSNSKLYATNCVFTGNTNSNLSIAQSATATLTDCYYTGTTSGTITGASVTSADDIGYSPNPTANSLTAYAADAASLKAMLDSGSVGTVRVMADIALTTDTYGPASGSKTVDLNGAHQLTIASGQTVTLKNMTIQAGENYSNASTKLNNAGTLKLENVNVVGAGKGLMNTGTAVLTGCSFYNNYSNATVSAVGGSNIRYSNYGGAVCSNNKLILDGCSFTGNTSNGYGGAFGVIGGSAYVNKCVFSDNAASGQACYVISGGSIYMMNSTALKTTANTDVVDIRGTFEATNNIFIGTFNVPGTRNYEVTSEECLNSTTPTQKGYGYYYPVKESSNATTAGVYATYFNYTDPTSVKMGYKATVSAEITYLVGTGDLAESDKVETYYEGGTRVANYVGASGLPYPTVTFNSNGGSPVESQQIRTESDTVTKPDDPTKTGYSFAGWYSDAGLTTEFNRWDATIPQSITLYAKWTVNPSLKQVVTFKANYDGGGEDYTQDVPREIATALAPNTFARDGWTFTGWNTAADGSGRPYADSAEIIAEGNITLYAQWTDLQDTDYYTVTDKPNRVIKLKDGTSQKPLLTNFTEALKSSAQTIIVPAAVVLTATGGINSDGVYDGKGKTVRVVTPYVAEGEGLPTAANTGPSNYRVFTVAVNVTIKNMTIIGGDGSAINQTAGTLTMENVTLERSCYGLQTSGGIAVLKNCTFRRCFTSNIGGALYGYGGNVILDGCSFTSNNSTSTANSHGGSAIWIYNASSKIYANNCVFAGNQSMHGGTIRQYYAGSLYLMNCTIAGNVTTGSTKYNAVTRDQGSIYAVNCVVADNYNTNGAPTQYNTSGNFTGGNNNYVVANGGTTASGFAAIYDGLYPVLTDGYIPISGVNADVRNGVAETYFDYRDLTDIKMGYKVSANDGSITPLGNLSAPGAGKVETYYEGGERAAGVIGASGVVPVVSYDANGGTGDEVATQSNPNSGSGVTLAVNTLTRTGYTANGWNTKADGSGTHYDSGASVAAGTALTLYAQWTAATYTVTLDTNDGTINSGDVTSYTYGVGATLPTSVTKTGYTFGGWYENSDLSGSEVTTISATDTGDKTYYAKWTTTPATAPTITTQPSSLNLTYGYTVGNTLTVAADSISEHTLSYQWYSNTTNSNEGGTAISGATSASYTVPTGKSAGTTEYYYCVVTATREDSSATATATSNVATVTIGKADITPTVTMSGYTYGDTVSEPSVSGNTGNGTVTYYYNTTNSTTGGTRWSDITPTSLNAGTYYLYATVAETDNYNAVTTGAVSFVVSKGTWAQTTASGAATQGSTGTVNLTGCLAAGGSFGSPTKSSDIIEGTPTVSGNTLSFKFTDTAADNATATITVPVTNATNYENYNITVTVTVTPKTAQNISFADAALTKIYGDTAFTNELSGAQTTVTYSVTAGTDVASVDTTTGEVTILKAGTATIAANAAASDAYLAASASYTLTVNKATPVVTAPTAIENLTYTGEAQALVNAGSAAGGTIQYSLAENGGYSATIPTGTDAGSYTVYYKVVGDANHSDVAPTGVAVTIGPKAVESPTIELNPSAFTYDGNDKEPTVTVKDGETVINASEYTVAYGNNTDAGTATVTVTDKTGGNYTVSGSANFTINKAASTTVIAGTPSVKKGGQTVNLSECVSGATGAVSYAISSGANDCTVDGSTGVFTSGANAGTCTVTVTVAEGTNHLPKSGTLTVAVTEKDTQTVTFPETAVTKTYGEAFTITATHSTGDGVVTYSVVSGNDVAEVNSSTGAVTTKKSGTATIRATAAETTTYASATADYTLTVNKADAVVTAPTVKTLTYTGEAQALINAGSTTGGELQYKLGADGTYSTSIPTATAAGDYTVYYKVVGGDNYIDVAEASVSVTISAIQVAAPVLPEPGSFTGSKSITITCATDGAAIYYTTDGSAPTSSGTEYTAAFSISATTTVKAIAVMENYTDSEVASATYTLSTPSYDDSGSSSSSSSSTTTTPSTTATTTNADGSTTQTTTQTTTTRNSDGSTTAKTTETATTTAADGAKTEAKTETSTTTKTTNGTTTATTATTETTTTTAADGTKSTTETTENRTVSTTTDASGAVSGTGTVSATAVTTAADGTTSTTVTEGVITVSTDEAGTVSTVTDATATTTDSAGNVTVTETVATEAVAKDGSTGETVVDKATEELISGEVVISQQALDTAIETEEPIQAPVTIPVSTAAASDASPISVKMPSFESGRLPVPKLPTVELQVTRGGFGAVAFQKLAGGVLRVIKECRMGSVIVPVEGDCELVIVDNSRDFLDVNENAWYKDSVDFVVSRSIFGGVSPRMFDPDAAMTRGMIAQMLYNFDRSAEAGAGNTFVDVSTGDWYVDAVGWANANGVITGYKVPAETTPWPMGFGPSDALTREQLVTILYRYAAFAGYDASFTSTLADWTDADSVANYAKDAMDWALYNDIIGGIEGALSPTTSATRAQVAAIMMRFVSNVR